MRHLLSLVCVLICSITFVAVLQCQLLSHHPMSRLLQQYYVAHLLTLLSLHTTTHIHPNHVLTEKMVLHLPHSHTAMNQRIDMKSFNTPKQVKRNSLDHHLQHVTCLALDTRLRL